MTLRWLCSPPPCGEGSGGGLEERSKAVPHGSTPHPDPPRPKLSILGFRPLN
jgi:hypothetical protein